VKDLVDTTEMYLRTIYDLEEEGVRPLRARIAERLEQSGPTVSQTVARMERDGLLLVAFDRHLKLTEKGRELAVSVMRKHRLAERLLVDVIGLEWEKVHAEACRWEHVMSEKVERRLVKVLNNPTTSPYGNPIPGLGLLGLDRPIGDPETCHRAGRPRSSSGVSQSMCSRIRTSSDGCGRWASFRTRTSLSRPGAVRSPLRCPATAGSILPRRWHMPSR
jgi:Mn-dependent DtxR family transcriptional regulator